MFIHLFKNFQHQKLSLSQFNNKSNYMYTLCLAGLVVLRVYLYLIKGLFVYVWCYHP